MKYHYRHLALATAATVFILALALAFAVREVHSELERESDRIQKLEARLNTIGVAERVEIDNNRIMKCSLEVVVCEEEKYQLNLQGL